VAPMMTPTSVRRDVAKSRERGVALLIVLLLMTVLSTVALAVTDDIRFAARRTANIRINTQMQWYALGSEVLARQILWRSWKANAHRSTLNDPWAAEGVEFAIDGGSITGQIHDGGNCFNLNSVVDRGSTGLYIARKAGQQEFQALLTALEMDRDQAIALSATLTDWIDSDSTASGRGAEDYVYSGRKTPYRTGGTLLAEPSELRAIAGFTAEVYGRIRPFVCALPTTDISRINVNTLREFQAPLVVMLAGSGVRVAEVERAILDRPAGGYARIEDFLAHDVFTGIDIAQDTRAQFVLRTEYYVMESEVVSHDARFTLSSLLQVNSGGEVTVHARRYGVFD